MEDAPEPPEMTVKDPYNWLVQATALRVAGKLENGEPTTEEPQGRHFVLMEACASGVDLLVEPAYAVAPALFTAEVCCHCLRVLSDEERAAAMASTHRCGLCNADETSFCSEACKERWATRHALECPLVDPLLGLLFHTPEVPMHAAILVLRLLTERLMLQPPHCDVAGTPHDLQNVRWNATRALQSHIHQFKHESLMSIAERMADLINGLHGVQRAGSHTLPQVATVKHLLCAVHFNAFAIKLPGQAQGAALCPGIAMANHSCDPNCEVVVVAGGKIGEPEVTLALRSLREIAAGEEATINYLTCPTWTAAARADGVASLRSADGLPVAARRKRLWNSKLFLCECNKCIMESALPVTASDNFTAHTTSSVEQNGRYVRVPNLMPDGSTVIVTMLKPFTAAWYETPPNSIRFHCQER